ncbi:MAG: hypothetical protein ACTSRZ_04270 [Promethearchaeota archaeon]
MYRRDNIINLTFILSKIKNKSKFFENVVPNFSNKLIFNQNFEIVNPYPDWVNERCMWAKFGTFSDYVIRKILINLFPKKIRSINLIAEKQVKFFEKVRITNLNKAEFEEKVMGQEDFEFYNKVGKSISASEDQNKKNNIRDDFQKDFQIYMEVPYLSNKDIEKFYLNLKVAKATVKLYKDSQKNWQELLYYIYCMSHLDLYYRKGIIELPKVGKDEIDMCINFFNRVEQLLKKKFSNINTKDIYLNPILGNRLTCVADADLIIDTCCYEIKTVKNAKRYIKNDIYQLLGYCSLLEWLKINIKDQSKYPILNSRDINKIGFIFPQQLKIIEFDISDWTRDKRIEYLHKLLKIKDQYFRFST